jgi:5-methylcytosine-specific restriction endonuclease McrA
MSEHCKPMTRIRKPILKTTQVEVFRRDGWLCRWCGRPVIFGPVMRYVERYVRQSGHNGPLAYFHLNWTRANAPLLDHLGAVVDHVKPFSDGGAHDPSNFATACNKCNQRKNAGRPKEPRRAIKSRHGEPVQWDGLSALFVVLVTAEQSGVTKTDLEWYAALSLDPRGSKGK